MADGLILVLGLAVIFYATVIHPNNVKERIILRALDVYELELKSGIKDGQMKELLEELGSDDKKEETEADK